MKKKSLEQFKKFEITTAQMDYQKGGAINIFCEIYIGRQKYNNEPIDPNVISVLKTWDQGLTQFFATFF